MGIQKGLQKLEFGKHGAWIFLPLWAALFQGSLLFANPEHPTCISGNIESLNSAASALELKASDRSIIHWESFSIGADESVHFILPDSSAAVLNQVTSHQLSHIDGLLHSNGTVYLINPNGILIGPSGVIDTAGFLASTLEIENQQFLLSQDMLFSGSSKATIVNQGTITGWSGDVILLAHCVENAQLVHAPQGVVALGCAEHILLTPRADQRITIQTPVVRPQEALVGIHQGGEIQAMQAELKADGNPYAYAINNEGFINATGVKVHEGRILLVAEGGLTSSSGILSATNENGSGGEIHILGQVVTLTDQAQVHASNEGKGGVILIGGDYQGNNPEILNALVTYVGPEVEICADAWQEGDGGKVIVWADQETSFYGKASAKGGVSGGNGGFTEVSGDALDFRGVVDLSAPQGVTGMLLLDPTNVTISTGVDSMTISGCGPPKTYTNPTNPATAIVNIANLLTNLGTCSVTITTASTNAAAGTVTVSNPINWTGTTTNSLTVTSNSTMTFNAAITNNTTAGTMTWNSGAATAVNAALTNGSGGAPTITLNSVGTITQAVGGPIVNSSNTGIINLTSTGAAADLTFNGTLTNSATSTGSINLTSGRDINLNAALTNNASSGSLNMLSVRDINPGATVTNTAGILSAQAGRSIGFSVGGSFSTSSSQASTWIANITTHGSFSTTTTSTLATSGTGTLTIEGNNATGANAISILGPINHSSSGLLSISPTTTGDINTGASTVITATSGPITVSSTPSGGTITLSGPITFTAAATGAFTVDAQNAEGGTNGVVLGNTLTYASSGPVTITAEDGNILTGASNTLMHFKSGSGGVSFSAPQGNVTTNAATVVTFDSGAGSLSMTTGSGGNITLNNALNFNSGGSASASLSADNSLSLSGFAYNAGGACTLNASSGSVTLGGTSNTFLIGNLSNSGATTVTAGTSISLGSAGSFTVGSAFASGAVSLSAGTTITGSATSTFTFDPLATSLTMLAGTNITLVNFFYDAPGNCSWTATSGSVTTSGTVGFQNGVGAVTTGGLIVQAGTNIATNGTLNYNAGAGVATLQGLQMTAIGGNITIGGAGSFNYSSSEPATLSAQNGNIVETGNITFNSGSGMLTLVTFGVSSGNITLNGTTLFNAGSGGLTIQANGNFSNAGPITYNSSQALNLTSVLGNITFNDTLSLNSSAPFTMTASAGSIMINSVVRNIGTGAINATCNGTLLVGTGASALPAQLGSMGGDVTINITGAGDVQLLAGTSANAFAQIGFDTGNVTSNLIFTRIGGNLVLLGGAAPSAYALIGHGSQIGAGAGGTRTGDITVGSLLNPVIGNVLLQGNNLISAPGVGSFAQIGHVRALSAPPVSAMGSIDMSFVTGSVSVLGGNAQGTYALIGHGGALSSQADSYTGSIQVQTLGPASAIILENGNATGALSAIGHVAYMNGAGVVSIEADTISVTSSNAISLTAQAGAEAVIGGYVNASSGSGSIVIDALDITTQNGGSLVMVGPITNTLFNGTLIGALAYTGSIPIVPAGTASANLNMTISGNLSMQPGTGGSSDQTFSLIQSGSGSPVGGTDLSISVTGNASLQGGNNQVAIESLSDLTLSVGGGLFLTADRITGSLGAAQILSNGLTQITADSLSMNGWAAGPAAQILNSAQDLSVMIGDDIEMFNNAQITLSGGSGTLSVTTMLGSIELNDNCFLSNAGTGSTVVSSAVDLILNVGNIGPVFISCLGPLTLTYGGDLSLVAGTPAGNASILSAGTTTITGGEHLSMRGALPLNAALIQNTTGDLTVTSKVITLQDLSQIQLIGGTGTLQVTATTEDITLLNSGIIQNQGTGNSVITSQQDLQIHGDVTSGGSSILSNGSMQVTAVGLVLMSGGEGNPASIRGMQGDLSVQGHFIDCVIYSDITLLGGSGTLSVTVDDDFLAANNSVIQSLGSGPLTLTVGGSISLIGGIGNGSILGNTGDLTINVINNLDLDSNPNGSATIQTHGNLFVNVGQSINMGGLGAAQQSLIQTTSGDLSLIANVNLTVHDNARIANSGTGSLTLVVDQAYPFAVGPGRFILDPQATVECSSGSVLHIFTASPNGIVMGNLAFGQANGLYVTAGLPCPFDEPPTSSTNRYHTYFSSFSGGFGIPYTIFYKSGSGIPSHRVLEQDLSIVSYASSELFFMLRKYTDNHWNSPFLVCCHDARTQAKKRRAPFDCESLSPGAYSLSLQNWTRYPIHLSENTSCTHP